MQYCFALFCLIAQAVPKLISHYRSMSYGVRRVRLRAQAASINRMNGKVAASRPKDKTPPERIKR